MEEELSTITFRVPVELRALMEAAASAEQRTISNWLRVIISKQLETAKAESEVSQ